MSKTCGERDTKKSNPSGDTMKGGGDGGVDRDHACTDTPCASAGPDWAKAARSKQYTVFYSRQHSCW